MFCSFLHCNVKRSRLKVNAFILCYGQWNFSSGWLRNHSQSNAKQEKENQTTWFPIPYPNQLFCPISLSFLFHFPRQFPHLLALWLSLSELTAKCFCLAMLCLKHMGSTGDGEADWECAELMMVRAQDRKNGSECSPSVLKTIKNCGSVFIYSIGNFSQRSPYLPQETLNFNSALNSMGSM